MKVTIFGNGNLGKAINQNLATNGEQVNFITHQNGQQVGELVILAVPYEAIDDIVSRYQRQLAEKIVVDATNPIDFQTWQLKATPSSAEKLAKKLPDSTILKAFNTTTAISMANAKLANDTAPQVLIAGDDQAAKQKLINTLSASPLSAVDVGPLARAQQLEQLGLLELSMAASKQLPLDGGVQLIK